MASQDKKKKLSKSEKKKLYQDRGKKGAEARGLGAQWTTEVTSYDHHEEGKVTWHP